MRRTQTAYDSTEQERESARWSWKGFAIAIALSILVAAGLVGGLLATDY